MTDIDRTHDIGTDESLSAMEKETTLTCPNDLDKCRIHSEVPTIIKWVLSIEESEVKDYRLNESDEICAVTATIPKGIIKLQGNSRKSNAHGGMVSYGPLR